MTKVEFIYALEAQITRLPEYERQKTISFYCESIDDRVEDGMDEEEAVASLGSVEEIAGQILLDTPLTSIIQTRIKESRNKSGNKKLWTILAICGSPFWVPLAIAFAAVIFAVYVTVWAVVISLIAAVFSLGLAGACGILGGVVGFFFRGPLVALSLLGAGLVCTGLFLMCVKPIERLCRQFVGLTTVFLRKIKRMFVKNEGVSI